MVSADTEGHGIMAAIASISRQQEQAAIEGDLLLRSIVGDLCVSLQSSSGEECSVELKEERGAEETESTRTLLLFICATT